MHIGIPRAIKSLEGRVALLSDACRQLVDAGHHVLPERDAGASSGYPDAGYADAGVRIVGDHAELFAESEPIVKFREPRSAELDLLKPEHCLFSFLHLAAEPDWKSAKPLSRGINIEAGSIRHPALKETFA